MVVQVFQESLSLTCFNRVLYLSGKEKRPKHGHITMKFKFKTSKSIYLEKDEINCSVLTVYLGYLLLTQLCQLLILSQHSKQLLSKRD